MLKKIDRHENVRHTVVNRDKNHERSGRPDVNRDTYHELKRGPTGRRSCVGVWHSPEWPYSRSWSCHKGSSMEISSGTRGRHQEEVEEELEEEVERRVERRTLKQPNTSAHAWMIWNDTQGETLSHKCDVWTHVHQQTVRGVLRTAHCTRQCALWCPCHCSQCAPGCSCCAWRCYAVCRSQMFVNMRCRIHSLYKPRTRRE